MAKRRNRSGSNSIGNSKKPKASPEKSGTSSKKKLAQKEKVRVESVAASPSSDFVEEPVMEMEDVENEEIECEVENNSSKKLEGKRRIKSRISDGYEEMFTGEPFSEEEARRRWPHRYVRKGKVSYFPTFFIRVSVNKLCKNFYWLN